MATAIVLYDDDARNRTKRVARAVERLREGRVASIIMVGGWRPVRAYSGSREMVNDAVGMGVDPSLLSRDERSNDTVSNLREGLRIASAQGTRQVEFISDRLHLARIRWLMASEFPNSSFRLVPIDETNASLVSLWRLNHEFLGYAAYWLAPRWMRESWLARQRSSMIGQSDSGSA